MVGESALGRENGLELSRRIVRRLDPFTVGALVPAYLTHVRAMHFPEDRGHIDPTCYCCTIDNVQEIG
jgi:hypothetical protein